METGKCNRPGCFSQWVACTEIWDAWHCAIDGDSYLFHVVVGGKVKPSVKVFTDSPCRRNCKRCSAVVAVRGDEGDKINEIA